MSIGISFDYHCFLWVKLEKGPKQRVAMGVWGLSVHSIGVGVDVKVVLVVVMIVVVVVAAAVVGFVVGFVTVLIVVVVEVAVVMVVRVLFFLAVAINMEVDEEIWKLFLPPLAEKDFLHESKEGFSLFALQEVSGG